MKRGPAAVTPIYEASSVPTELFETSPAISHISAMTPRPYAPAASGGSAAGEPITCAARPRRLIQLCSSSRYV